ncbi:MAG: DUF58 domain-containing protein [Pseudomonadota bacterium]
MATRSIDWQDLGFRVMSTFQRRKRPEALPIVLTSKRVYVFPTKFGVFFGFFTLMMIAGALNYNNNMALMLTFLIGGFALLMPLYTVRNLVDLQITQVNAHPVHAGELATFTLTVMNDHSKPRAVIWTDSEDGDPMVTDVPGAGSVAFQTRQQTTTRGWMPMRRTRVFTRYPVGVFFSWCWLEPDARCLVYPRPEAIAPPLPRGGDRGTGRPERRGDEEWHGLREYQPGDPSRWIAWKVAARTDQMTTKTFAQHQSERIALRFDDTRGLAIEERLSRLTRWALDAHEARLEYTLELPAESIGPGRGSEHLHRCLRSLAEYNA